MAWAYPEGECFFERVSLDNKNGWTADNSEQFYSCVLVEIAWNVWWDGARHPPGPEPGTRALLDIVDNPRPQNYSTNFRAWDRLPICFGNKKDGSDSVGTWAWGTAKMATIIETTTVVDQ